MSQDFSVWIERDYRTIMVSGRKTAFLEKWPAEMEASPFSFRYTDDTSKWLGSYIRRKSRRTLAGVSGVGLSSFRKNDSLNEGVQGCRLVCHALSQSRLQAISEEAKRLGVARAHALKGGSQGEHEDRAE